MKLRLLYLYLFSFVGLLIVVIGSIQFVDLGMRMFLFKDIDYYEVSPALDKEGKVVESDKDALMRQQREVNRNRQRQFVSASSMILVGLPLYLYHWKTIKKERES